MKRPTLHDVAALAGVSHTTVARTLHHPRTVRPATRERVEQAIAQCGYRPDPVLSALATYRMQQRPQRNEGHRIVFLDCDGSQYSQLLLEGARAEAQLLGYSVEERSLAKERDLRRLDRELRHRGIRGLLFGPAEEVMDFTSSWSWEAFAVVSLGLLSHRPALHAVAMNYFAAAYEATHQLLARGCRRIGLAIDPRLERRTGDQWLGGYAAGLGGKKPLRVATEIEPKPLLAQAHRQRWDAVLTIHDTVAEALQPLPALLLNDFFRGTGLPYYALHPGSIGREGVRLLHHGLLRQEYGLPEQPRRLLLDGHWVG